MPSFIKGKSGTEKKKEKYDNFLCHIQFFYAFCKIFLADSLHLFGINTHISYINIP